MFCRNEHGRLYKVETRLYKHTFPSHNIILLEQYYNFIILHSLQIMNMSQSKSHLDHSIQFVELQNIPHSKEIIKRQINQVQSENIHEMRSESSSKTRKQLENVEYKVSLLRLMVLVRIEHLGYKENELKQLIDREMNSLENIHTIEGKDLDFKATQISLNIIANLLGQENSEFAIRRGINPLPNPLERQQQNQMPSAEVEPRQILCNICYNINSNFCEQQCGHTFCMDCMRGYIKQNERSGNYIVKCREFDCTAYINERIIKLVLNPGELKRFLHFKEKNEKEMNPDNKFCSKPDCGQLLERSSDRLKCSKCESIYCEICLQYFHDDNPCDIVLRSAIQNTYRSFKIKKCPNCKSPIEKESGCNHMTCKKCKFQFCWLCLKKYTHHHYRYYNCLGCPGMQFQDEGELAAERAKQILLFLLLPFIVLLILFCYLAAIPIYMIGVFFYKPCYWIDSEVDFVQQKIVDSLCCCLGGFICRLLKWILFQPRAALYAVLLSPIKLTLMFCGQFCKIFE